MRFRGRRSRIIFTCAGLLFTGLGFLGVFLPVLPATPFFLLAATSFARGNSRLHKWLLGLPRVGPAIRDYEDGLGIPRRTKILATALVAVTVGLTATLGLDHWGLQLATVALGTYGGIFLWKRVPTREDVLEAREPALPRGWAEPM